MREHYTVKKTIKEANRIKNTFFENGLDADWEAYTLLDYASENVRIGEITLIEKTIFGTDKKMYRPSFNFEVTDADPKLTMDEAHEEARRILGTVYTSAEEALDEVNSLKHNAPKGFEVDHCVIDRIPVFEKDSFVYTADFEASVYNKAYDDYARDIEDEKDDVEEDNEFVKSVELIQTTDGSPLYYSEFGPYKLANLRKNGPLPDVHKEFTSTDDFLLSRDVYTNYVVYPLVVTEDEKTEEAHIEVREYSQDTMSSEEVNAVIYANAADPRLSNFTKEELFSAVQDYEYWMNGLGWECDLYEGECFVESFAGFYGPEKDVVRDMINNFDEDKYYDDFRGLLSEGMYCYTKD